MSFHNILAANTFLANYWATFLPAGTIFALVRTSHQWRWYGENWRRNRLLTKRLIATLPPGLAERLCDLHTTLSGSSVLRAIEGGNWTANDLDLYTLKNDGQLLTNYLKSLQPTEVKGQVYEDLAIPDVLTYIIGDRSYQHISIPGQSVSQYVVEKYDLSFLSNTYNGRMLVVADVPALISHETKFVPNQTQHPETTADSLYVKYYERIVKYQSRGYTYSNVTIETIITTPIPLRVFYLNGQIWMSWVKLDDALELIKRRLRPDYWPTSYYAPASDGSLPLVGILFIVEYSCRRLLPHRATDEILSEWRTYLRKEFVPHFP